MKNPQIVPITVALVDDEPLLREVVRIRLNQDEYIQVVGEGSAGEDVFPLIEEYKPDILILDVNMPQYHQGDPSIRFQALPTISQLSQQNKEMAIIMLTVVSQPGMIHGALARGVQGYILKSDDISLSLPVAVKQVTKGEVYFSKSIEKELFAKAIRRDRSVNLSDRQIEALTRLTNNANASYAQHAQTMNISESTFRKHVQNACQTLGVNNSRAAIVKAMQIGFIPPPNNIYS